MPSLESVLVFIICARLGHNCLYLLSHLTSSKALISKLSDSYSEESRTSTVGMTGLRA